MGDTNSSNPNHLQKTKLIPHGIIYPFILLASCFMWWGIANNLTDPLVRVFKAIFGELSVFQASLIQFAFYFGYFCMAIPEEKHSCQGNYKKEDKLFISPLFINLSNSSLLNF